MPLNPAVQVHLNCKSSSCDTIQFPPFKQGESLQGSSAKGNIHPGVTSLRLNDCLVLMRSLSPVILKLLDKVKVKNFYSYMGICNIHRSNQVQSNNCKVKNPNWREARQMTIFKHKERFATVSYHETSLCSGQRAGVNAHKSGAPTDSDSLPRFRASIFWYPGISERHTHDLNLCSWDIFKER